MLKKLICIIIYSVFYFNMEAQQQAIKMKDLLANVMAKADNVLKNKKVEESCKTNIRQLKQFKDSLSRNNKRNLDSATLGELEVLSKNFIDSAEKNNRCKDANLTSL